MFLRSCDVCNIFGSREIDQKGPIWYFLMPIGTLRQMHRRLVWSEQKEKRQYRKLYNFGDRRSKYVVQAIRAICEVCTARDLVRPKCSYILWTFEKYISMFCFAMWWRNGEDRRNSDSWFGNRKFLHKVWRTTTRPNAAVRWHSINVEFECVTWTAFERSNLILSDLYKYSSWQILNQIKSERNSFNLMCVFMSELCSIF